MEEEAKAALYAKIAQQQEAQLRLESELREARDYTDRESACDVIYEESRRLKTVTTMQEESRAHIIDLKLSLKYDENAKDKQELIQGWLKGIERDSRKAIREAEERLTREHSKLRSLEEKSRKLLHSSSLCEQRAMHLKKQLAEKRG